MKKIILFLIMLFIAIPLFALEPILKVNLQNGSSKQYKITEIENLTFYESNLPCIMSIYQNGSLKKNTDVRNIDSIRFEMPNIMKTFLIDETLFYDIANVDSIVFTYKPLAVGDFYQGGIIGYIFAPNDLCYKAGETHGLIVTQFDQGTANWGCFGTSIGTTNQFMCQGNINTMRILSGCSEAAIAARLCDDLKENGYSDWYLPSSEELIALYSNKSKIGGYLEGTAYWTSTEFDLYGAWTVVFDTGFSSASSKKVLNRVRAVRQF